jgi:hypothetical protein
MSHFTVAVFSKSVDDVDNLLVKFEEELDLEFEEDEEYEKDKKTGKCGFWYNPNAKWDWYQIGGRWSGSIKLKNGHCGNLGEKSWANERVEIPENMTDQALVKDCDFSMNQEEYNKAIRFWEVVIDHSELKNGESNDDFTTFYRESYYTNKYKTKEDYAKHCASFTTFAFVTDNGEWNEEGSMGWFGCSDTTNESLKSYQSTFEEYLKYAEQNDLYITIVDCHI